MWKLKTETEKQRIYKNEFGGEIKTALIYTDTAGAKWWAFNNILELPPVRVGFSKAISDTFQTGVSHSDLKKWFSEMKEMLRTNDAEKYEKIYAFILKKESIIDTIADSLKQHLGLATVYILSDSEKIDEFNYDIGNKKLKQWDQPAQTFFLNWLFDRIQKHSDRLNKLLDFAELLN